MPVTSPHPRIISLLNHKGGVGKTATVANLTDQAAARGMHVLLIDMDKQASLTTRVGVPAEGPQAPQFNVNDVIAAAEKGVAKEATIPTAWDGVDIIPSSLDLTAQEANVSMGASRLLARALDDPDWLSGYDLVLIDCPPSLGMLSSMALDASDEVLLVTEAEAPSIKGVHQTIGSIKMLDPDYRIRGLVVNRYRRGTREHEERLEEIRSDQVLAPLLWEPVVPMRTVVSEASGTTEPLSALGSKAKPVCEIYAALLDKLVNPGGE